MLREKQCNLRFLERTDRIPQGKDYFISFTPSDQNAEKENEYNDRKQELI
jgi:hypothetical protein